jgi:UDP-3-O-[3-hydroxymyristoyl] glucosamine N-acyltransferase
LVSIVGEKYLFEGNEHKIALIHKRMRYGQFGSVDVEVIIEKDVNVDDAVVVGDS